ncbi:hypothetical protein CUC53_16610 [Aeromonas cavernicola]|uniref:Uncharacterized protein n=1 Tax=Aeromonas cavernicola TaxID=1006623 RepID=A0A2H9U103_9GAMM|nr:hypothetical protein CUC53_16610 [Aeromonas cavernicola]
MEHVARIAGMQSNNFMTAWPHQNCGQGFLVTDAATRHSMSGGFLLELAICAAVHCTRNLATPTG